MSGRPTGITNSGWLGRWVAGYLAGRCRFAGEPPEELTESEVEQSGDIWSVSPARHERPGDRSAVR